MNGKVCAQDRSRHPSNKSNSSENDELLKALEAALKRIKAATGESSEEGEA